MYFIKQILNTVSNSAIANTIYHSEVFSFLKGCKQSESIIFCGICTMYIIIGLDNASVFGIEGKMTLKSQQILLFQEAGRMLWWTDVKMLVYFWSAELSDLWSLVFDCWLVDGLWCLIFDCWSTGNRWSIPWNAVQPPLPRVSQLWKYLSRPLKVMNKEFCMQIFVSSYCTIFQI